MKRARLGAAIAIGLLVAAAVAGPIVLRPLLSRWVWNELSAHLENLFDARLAAESFHVFLFPTVRVEGTGLSLTKRDRPEATPLIAIRTFSVSTSFHRLWDGNVRTVTVDGLAIFIPPDSRPSMKPTSADRQNRQDPRNPKNPQNLQNPQDLQNLQSPPPAAETSRARARRIARGLTIDEIVSTAARLVIAPDDPSGVPLVFDIELARLQEFSSFAPARFEARLMNPKPRGEITATGKVGPWQSGDPRTTHVEGDYTLRRADMSVFRGIGGTLDSTGHFGGELAEISVEGSTTMPDFSVETGGHPMPLNTTFAARVDGTNGNTYLTRVSAKLGNSPLEASGEIAGVPGGKGKAIRLHVTTANAELADLIFLVVDARPSPMRGQLVLDARMELPPGDEPVVDALRLRGKFTIRRGQFASDTVQDKVDELSRKGRGQPGDASIDNVISEFGGDFSLRNGVLELPSLRFAVRGAEVLLAGSYGLRGESLGFTGHLRLQARVSQTTTGFKSFLLKAIDPFFSKNGAGTELPIKVGGTVSSPEFGLNMFGKKKAGVVNAPSARPSRDRPSRRPGS
jgi:hypothetical protein